LETLRDVRSPHKHETFPLIYHIDVAAMYPNIILTNRLQPVSIVNDQVCSGCLFNQPENKCKRELEWEWRGTVFPLNEGEHLQIREKISAKFEGEGQELEKAIKAEVKAYSQRIYKKTHTELTETRADVVCMRENSFYVDTVRAFRDRRYEYKHLAKTS
jgi:DNA polymerase epsilon subunit 1